MTRYRGDEKVEPGLYFNIKQLAFKSMDDEGRLPGTERDEYRRVPIVVLLLAGPVLGGLYVVFLPFIGFAMLAWVVAGKLGEVVAGAAVAAVRVLKPAWQPAMAFLSRGKPARNTEKRKDRWAEEVKEELEHDAS